MSVNPGPTETSSTGKVPRDLLSRLRTEMLDIGESERYRLLAVLLGDLADHHQTSGNGRDSGLSEQLAAATKRVQSVTEEAASLRDEIATLKADLAVAAKQLGEEQARNQEFRKTIDSQRQRLEEARKKEAELEAEVVAKNAALHKAETSAENFQLQAQRLEVATQDTSRITKLENEKRALATSYTELETALETLRADKDREIAELKNRLVSANTQVGAGADELLHLLWERLARTKPALVDVTAKPNRQAAERLFDAFIELAYFANGFESQMRPFLDRYTRHNELVARPWKVYRSYEDILETITKTIAVAGGKPVGVLKIRLRDLNKWTMGALMGGDVAVESVGSELESQLRGPACMGANPNMTIKDFIRNDGHERFRDHMLEVRSHKLSEVYKLTT